MRKYIEQETYQKFYKTLYSYKVDLEKTDRKADGTWTKEEARLIHFHLDQLQWILEYMNKDCNMLMPTAVEEISDFELIQNLLHKSEMKEEEKKNFLLWYLWHHHQFFKNSQNKAMWETIMANFGSLRAKILEIIEDCQTPYPVKQASFDQMQAETLLLAQYYSNGNPSLKMRAKEILRRWNVEEEQIELILPNNEKEVIEQPESKEKTNKIEPEKKSKVKMEMPKKDLEHQKRCFQKRKLVNILESLNQGICLSEEELEKALKIIYDVHEKDERKKKFQELRSQNERNIRFHSNVIRSTSLTQEEEMIYQKIEQISKEDMEYCNPIYWKQIKNSISEINEITRMMIFLNEGSADYQVYQEMLQEEIQKVADILPYLYVKERRKRTRVSC